MRVKQDNINSLAHWEDEYRKEQSNNYDGLKNIFLSAMVEDGKRVLDVGCGVGFLCNQIKYDRSACEVWGIDFSAVGILRAKTAVQGCSFAVMDLHHMEFGDHTFDYVFCCEVFEHLEDPDVVVKELARVSRNAVIVTVPYKDHIPSAEHIQQYDYEEMRQMFLPYFEQVWVAPMASGRYVKNYNTGEVIYPCGHWDEIFLVAKGPKT